MKTDEYLFESKTTTTAWKGKGKTTKNRYQWVKDGGFDEFLIRNTVPVMSSVFPRVLIDVICHTKDMQVTQYRHAWPISHTHKQENKDTNKLNPPTHRTHKVRRSSWEVKGLIHPAWQNVHFQNPAVMKWKHTHQKVTEEALENGKWTLKEGGGRGEKKPIYTAYHTHRLMSNTISQNHIILYLSQNVCITVAYGWIIYDVCVFRNDGWKDWRGVQNFFFLSKCQQIH